MSKLPDLPQSIDKKGRRQKRKSQPFWNEELGNLWKIRCQKEKYLSDFVCKSRFDMAQKKGFKDKF